MAHKNNSSDNLIGLCPNHHKMVHHRAHQKEVFETLKEKGFNEPDIYEDDNVFKK
jgi:predicted HNH restriction endonuclease